MSDLRNQWAVVQKRVPPPTHWRKHKNALTSWKVAYAELTHALPRPIRVAKFGDGWGIECRLRHNTFVSLLGIIPDLKPTPAEAYDDAMEHLHHAHGCPSWQASGEPCTDACEDCNGWGWRA